MLVWATYHAFQQFYNEFVVKHPSNLWLKLKILEYSIFSLLVWCLKWLETGKYFLLQILRQCVWCCVKSRGNLHQATEELKFGSSNFVISTFKFSFKLSCLLWQIDKYRKYLLKFKLLLMLKLLKVDFKFHNWIWKVKKFYRGHQ